MYAVNRKTGAVIVGTLEHLTGVANIVEDSFTVRNGRITDFDYNGETKIYWDEQKTVYRGRDRVFVDEHGYEVLESDLEFCETEGRTDD